MAKACRAGAWLVRRCHRGETTAIGSLGMFFTFIKPSDIMRFLRTFEHMFEDCEHKFLNTIFVKAKFKEELWGHLN